MWIWFKKVYHDELQSQWQSAEGISIMKRHDCCQSCAYLRPKQGTEEENEAARLILIIFPPKPSLLIDKFLFWWLEEENKN